MRGIAPGLGAGLFGVLVLGLYWLAVRCIDTPRQYDGLGILLAALGVALISIGVALLSRGERTAWSLVLLGAAGLAIVLVRQPFVSCGQFPGPS